MAWRYEKRDSKLTKVPIDPATGSYAKTDDRTTWASHGAAVLAVKRFRCDGVGFVFSDDDPFTGVDLDGCRNAVTGEIAPWAQKIIDDLNSYTEISPSRCGVKIWFRGKLQRGVRNRAAHQSGEVEIYSRTRFFTVTGEHVDGTPTSIKKRQNALDALHSSIFGAKVSKQVAVLGRVVGRPVQLSDAALIARARRASNGARFRKLWKGDWSDYPSQSEGDIALCCHLAHWTQSDASRIAALFRQSGLMRKKWDREDYRQRTIAAACALQLSDATPQPAYQWPEPMPLADIQPARIRPNLIPGVIGEYIRDVALWSETPTELPLLAVFGVLSCVLGGKLQVSPESGYSEPVHLFLCPALESGNRKTAVVSETTKPLVEWEQQQQQALKSKIAHTLSVRKTRMALIERARKSVKMGDAKGIAKIAQMEAALPDIPQLPELFTSDITSEKLELMLAEQGGRAALISDEGGIFDIMAGRYNDKTNLDVFLKGHAGSAHRVHRVSRERVIIENPALTVMVSPQPGCLAELRDRATLRHRGVLARFLYAYPQSLVGSRTLDPEPMPQNSVKAYKDIVERLLNWKPEGRITLTLSQKAYAAWKDFQRGVETLMADGGDLCRLRDWGGKLPGAALRVVGILHAAKAASKVSKKDLLSVLSAKIELAEMQVAIELCETLITHAIAVFGLITEDPTTSRAKRVLRWLSSQGQPEISKRECFRAHQPHVFDRVDQLDGPLFILEKHHLVRVDERETGGRRKEMIVMNPALLKK